MTERTLAIAPSILAADFSRLESEIRTVERGGADLLHVDVMDGHFVPNLTFGPMLVQAMRKLTDLPLSTHLMMSEPHRYLKEFAEAGSETIIIHIELYEDPRPWLEEIRGLGCRAGLTLNPATPISAVEPFLGDVDVFLVMSVHPGFGGQKFMPEVLPKATRAVQLRGEHGYDYEVHIDGGIGPETAPDAVRAGAEVLVAGSAVFGAPDPAERVRTLRELAQGALST